MDDYVSLTLLQCFSLQGKKGRPGEDGSPGPKGQKVQTCIYFTQLKHMQTTWAAFPF